MSSPAAAKHILAISGSLRRQSFNTGLLRAAVELAPPGMTITITDIGGFPLYDDDVRLEGYPPVVQAFRDQITAADGLLMACPEYNYSVSGVLKNAIDWASRPPGNLFNEKPVAIVGAATGLFGSIRGQNHLRAILAGLNCNVLHKPEVMVASAASKFDAEGKLTDETARKLIGELLVKLAAT
jgi:chromate reductase